MSEQTLSEQFSLNNGSAFEIIQNAMYAWLSFDPEKERDKTKELLVVLQSLPDKQGFQSLELGQYSWFIEKSGLLHLYLNKPENAIPYLEELVELDKNNPHYKGNMLQHLCILANTYNQTQRPHMAAQIYLHAFGNSENLDNMFGHFAELMMRIRTNIPRHDTMEPVTDCNSIIIKALMIDCNHHGIPPEHTEKKTQAELQILKEEIIESAKTLFKKYYPDEIWDIETLNPDKPLPENLLPLHNKCAITPSAE